MRIERSKTTKVSPARRAAFEILRRVEEGGAYASTLLATRAVELKPNDRALTHELVMGVLRRQLWLDRLMAHLVGRDPGRLDAVVRLSLRLGLYQLRFMSRIPASAAVNESVSLVRQARVSSATSLVNAVLRRATREPEYDPAAEISDRLERLAVDTSQPLWLIKRWVAAWGIAETERFARANNEAAPLSFRIRNEPANGDAVIRSLEASGAELKASSVAPGGWRLSGPATRLQELAREGQVYIQDEASQLVAHVLNAQANERVLDLCAAPGSKTTHIADLSGTQSLIVAADIHQHRLRSAKKSSVVQGLSNIEFVALDGSRPLPFAEQSFDRVLVDAPCTGTGTLQRNPEIRWRLTAADIADLASRQLQILVQAARMVKPGGRLVYSTCSVEPEENEEVIDKFVAQAADFRRLTLQVNPQFITDSGAARTWPHRDGADGFFISSFERR
jgi:16S rRNA (cytosine967-C5)-methyltransferase